MTEPRYTTKLLYGRYLYQINLMLILPPTTRHQTLNFREKEVALFDIRRWLSDRCENGYRTYVSWRRSENGDQAQSTYVHRCFFNLYLRDRADFDAFVADHSGMVIETMKPASREHEDLLKQGIQVEIRDKLFYRRFRYRVKFRGGWQGKSRMHIMENVRSQLFDPSRKKQAYLLSSYDCTLYVESQSDLMLIRLSMGEIIKGLTVVTTREEAIAQ